ncbi:LIC11469 family lipoprotein adhesin Lsa20 [Leptospira yasudae]|uniref:LIC11469 family lipoprotein adhesin Lsa20 n=1 Tax=Leptospira yasudae TaxID=2202201 RepID=UPI003850821A
MYLRKNGCLKNTMTAIQVTNENRNGRRSRFAKIALLLPLLIACVTCKKDGSGATQAENLASDPQRQIQVQILWEKKSFPLEMELYEGASQRPVDLWATGNVKTLSEAPVSEKISGNDLYLKPGSKKRFVLVVKNTSDRDFYFFAAPHSMVPAEASLGFKFKCLCVNHAFYVPAKEIWYRVVELRTGGETLGKEMKITHTLVGMDEDRIQLYQKRIGTGGSTED